MHQLQDPIDKVWGCLERSINEWRTTLSTLRHSGDADSASQGQSREHGDHLGLMHVPISSLAHARRQFLGGMYKFC